MTQRFGRRIRLSLRSKMVLAIATVEIVMLSILIVNSILVMSETSRERMEAWTKTAAELFAVASTNAALSLDVASLKDLVLMLKRHEDVVYVSVEDADGILLAHSDPAQMGRPNTATADQGLDLNAPVFNLTAPIVVAGKEWGKVRMGFSTQRVREGIAQIRTRGLVIAAAEVFASAVVALVLGWVLTRSLVRLVGAARAMERGDLDQRVPVTTSDEVGELAHAFNEMTQSLKVLYTGLEAKVQERTVALQASHREVESKNAELEAKNQELEAFVYTVTHDLRAPLVALQGMAGMLAETKGAQLDAEGQHYLNRLLRNTTHMEEIIRDLLEFSRVGRLPRPPEAVAVAEVVDEILLQRAEEIREKGIKVSCRDLPMLCGERTRVEQVFSNLVGNALKFLGENNPAPAIEIGAEDRGGEWECCVRDNGIGIAPEYHGKVFELFQRLREIEAEGTGVGLAIVKKIVELAGGKIWIESEAGKGAAFRFTWPKGQKGEVQ